MKTKEVEKLIDNLEKSSWLLSDRDVRRIDERVWQQFKEKLLKMIENNEGDKNDKHIKNS